MQIYCVLAPTHISEFIIVQKLINVIDGLLISIKINPSTNVSISIEFILLLGVVIA